MPILDSIKIWIEMEDLNLLEFGERKTDMGTAVSCRIPSVEDKPFVICIQQLEAPPDGIACVAQVYVDGKRTNKTKLHKYSVTRITGVRTERNVRKQFRFSAPSYKNAVDVEKAAAAHEEEAGAVNKITVVEQDLVRIANMGTIRVIIAYVKLEMKHSDEEAASRRFHPRTNIVDLMPLPDLSKRIPVHYTTLGDETVVHHKGGTKMQIVPGYTVLQFDIHYGPIDQLRLEGSNSTLQYLSTTTAMAKQRATTALIMPPPTPLFFPPPIARNAANTQFDFEAQVIL